MITSYDTNAHVHSTFNLQDKHGGSVFMLEFQTDFSIFSL